MEAKVVILSRQNIDEIFLRNLFEYGFLAGEIKKYGTVDEALTVSDKEVELVLFQLDGIDNTAIVKALYLKFKSAPIIVFAAPEDEKAAIELLQYGVQDIIILNPGHVSHDFKLTINKALKRKQFSKQIDEHNDRLINEVRTSNRMLDHILSSINEVVWSCTAGNFEVVYINNACYDIYGFSPNEIIGNSDLLFGRVLQEDKHQFESGWRELLRTGKSVSEYRIIHKDGTIKYMKNESVLRRDHNNGPEFINGFARDITLQKMQLRKIQEQNEQLQEIARIHSHKIRGPLASILGLTQLFNVEKADVENREIIDHINTAANNLDLVIHDIVRQTDHRLRLQ
jgi:PAS domain S-box-containing protein